MQFQPESVLQALRLAAVVESSDDAIISKDVDGIVTSWNAAAERMFGWTAAEMIGQSVRAIIPLDRYAEEDLVLLRIRRGESVEHFETVRQRRNGEQFDVSITVSPIRTPDGAIIGASKIARDISDRKRTERALLDARAEQADLRRRLTTIIDASGALLTSPQIDDVLPALLGVASEVLPADGIAVWHVQRDEWRVAASQGLSPAFTARPGEATGEAALADGAPLPLESIDDPRLARRRLAFEAEGLQSALVVPLQPGIEMRACICFYFRTARRFGSVELESVSGLGRLASAVIATAFLYDDQRRRRLESEFVADIGASLARSRDLRNSLLRLAVLAVPLLADWCAVHLLREDGQLELAAAGGGAPDADGGLDELLRAPGDGADDEFSVERVMRTGASVVLARLTPGDGGRSEARRRAVTLMGDVSLVCVPLVAHGRALGTLTFIRKADGRRTRDTLDLGFAQDLAYRVALSIDTIQAYEEVRTANRLKDEFLASLSHELRTPLNAIVGYAQMLKQGALADEKRGRAYDVLEKNATTLMQIVEDVLDISRIVTGKIRLTLQPMALGPLLQQSVDTVQPAADAKGVRLLLTRDETADVVVADSVRLQQVFWNLLSNAVKFTPRGGRIDVRVSSGEGACLVTVRDTGAGIDPGFLPFIFERFRQADTRYGRENGGLGLGLAIARQIVEMHGGTIDASSEGPGAGAVFRVSLPAQAT